MTDDSEVTDHATPSVDATAVGTVVEAAARATTALEAAQSAHARWLEALETETTRRYELLTSQAELDAELIRIHGRREAHAIMAAARQRCGEPAAEALAETEQLAEIGETFSRFAESLEIAVESTSRPERY